MTEQTTASTNVITLPFGISLSTTETWLVALAIIAACAVAVVLGRWWYKSRRAAL